MFGKWSIRKQVAAGLIVVTGLVISGCSTTSRELAYDNTVQVAKRPVTGIAHVGWRIKTFWSEELVSSWRRYISFPLLSMNQAPQTEPTGEMMARDKLASWLDKKAGPPTRGSVQLLLNGDQFFPHFIASISNATNRIDLKAYIFDNDDVAKQIADLLKAHRETVDIRILYDAGGSRLAWDVDAKSLPESGADGVEDMADYLEKGTAIQIRRSSHTLLSSEHSKYYLIDNRIAYFGGMNIGREYRYDWRDAMFALTGPVVDALSYRFESAWIVATGDPLTLLKLPKEKPSSATEKNCDLYLVGTTPFSHDLYKGQLRAIKKAKKRIYIENPYLWNQPIIYQLCAARKRGVDVRVTIPREVNHQIGVSANKGTINRLLKHGVRVFIYPGMTHVKAAIYDQWACFGSANFDNLSLHKNYELNIFTDNQDVVRQIHEEVLKDGQEISTEIFDEKELTFTDIVNARIAQHL